MQETEWAIKNYVITVSTAVWFIIMKTRSFLCDHNLLTSDRQHPHSHFAKSTNTCIWMISCVYLFVELEKKEKQLKQGITHTRIEKDNIESFCFLKNWVWPIAYLLAWPSTVEHTCKFLPPWDGRVAAWTDRYCTQCSESFYQMESAFEDEHSFALLAMLICFKDIQKYSMVGYYTKVGITCAKTAQHSTVWVCTYT